MIHDERRLHRPFGYDRFGLRKWQGSSFTSSTALIVF